MAERQDRLEGGQEVSQERVELRWTLEVCQVARAGDDLAPRTGQGASVGLCHEREARDVRLAGDDQRGDREAAQFQQWIRVAPAARDPAGPVAAPVVEDD